MQFEILTSDAPPQASPSPVSGWQAAGQQLPADEDSARRLAKLRNRLVLANRQGHQRARGLLRQLRAMRQQAESRLQPPTATLSDSPLSAELAERQGQLERQVEQLHGRELELTLQAQQLQSERSELDALRGALEQQQASWHEEKSATEEQYRQQTEQLQMREVELTHQAERLQSDRSELDVLRGALEQQQALWHEEKSATEEQYRRRGAELQARQQQLEAESDASRQQRAQWEATRSESESNREAQFRQLQEQLAELEPQRQALDEARSRFDAEIVQARQDLDQQSAALAAHQTDLRAAVDKFQQRQRDWQERCEREEAELAERRGQMDAEWDELKSEREGLRRERECWEQERAAQAETRRMETPQEVTGARQEMPLSPEMPPREAGSQGLALDSLEIFRRLGTMPHWEDEGDSRAAPQASEPTASAVHAAGEHAPGHEDESVDQYMARLLERVRGASERADAPVVPESPPVPSVEPPATSEEPPIPDIPAVLTRGRPAVATGLSPRAVAPEKLSDLSAMRELANFSAQAALHQHRRGELIRATRMKLLVAVSGLAAGGLMLWAWCSRSVADLVFYGALTSFLVALIWGIQYALLTGHLIVNRAGHLKWSSESPRADSDKLSTEGPPPADLGQAVATSAADGPALAATASERLSEAPPSDV